MNNATTSTAVRIESNPGLPWIVRALWFILIGWHLTLYWIAIAWLLNVSIVGLPFGLWMLNRVPQVLTLRPTRGVVVGQMQNGRWATTIYDAVPQTAWPVRALYFVLIGWWFSLLWSVAAYLLCVTIIGLPFGLLMFNALPGVTTLARS